MLFEISVKIEAFPPLVRHPLGIPDEIPPRVLHRVGHGMGASLLGGEFSDGSMVVSFKSGAGGCSSAESFKKKVKKYPFSRHFLVFVRFQPKKYQKISIKN